MFIARGLFLFLFLIFSQCSGGGGGGMNPLIFLLMGSGSKTGSIGTGAPRNVLVSWQANREKSVNSAGGGYKACYGINPSYQAATAICSTVPYASGSAAPTSATLSIPGGSHVYIYVFGYSTLNPNGTPAATPTTVSVN
ncbi:hypothetical protein EHO61_15575 [Leptospira fluminis]|uniref:Uncharacterized protein n=2 Tax=Leptospira fluminis TaxID=2484979 RepID=A0A4R9GKP3_9LEPT|nr:hypothetical protein EHO61_15575 [Leptospira fluminis]